MIPILKQNDMRKLKVKLPYKSLEDIYLKESFAKPVPPLSRQTVLFEAPEDKTIDVYAQIDGSDKPKLLGAVDKKGFTKITNIVGSDTSGNVFKELINTCNLQGLENFIYPIFEKYNVNYKEVKRLLVDGKETQAMQFPISSKLVGKSGSFELWNSLKPVIKAILVEQEEDDAANLFSELFNFEPPKGTVATGKGELVIILFSDGKKVKYEKEEVSKGDIILSDGRRLELKIGRGRLASARSRGFEKSRQSAEQLVHKKMTGEAVTFEELKSVNLSLSKDDDINYALQFINKSTDPNALESLIWAPSLLGYGGKGFEYLLIMSNKDRAAGKYILSYFEIKDKAVILDALTNKQLSVYADNEGLTISSDSRPTGKSVYKQYSTKPVKATTKKASTAFIPPERPPAVPLQPATQEQPNVNL